MQWESHQQPAEFLTTQEVLDRFRIRREDLLVVVPVILVCASGERVVIERAVKATGYGPRRYAVRPVATVADYPQFYKLKSEPKYPAATPGADVIDTRVRDTR